ncbi:MAG: anti-sigma factor family protein [Betaproteobacteria bacterium]
MLERVSAYIDGELEDVECHAIEAHCQACPTCAAFIDSLRHTVGLCREAGGRPLPESVRALARSRIAELISRSKRGARGGP